MIDRGGCCDSETHENRRDYREKLPPFSTQPTRLRDISEQSVNLLSNDIPDKGNEWERCKERFGIAAAWKRQHNRNTEEQCRKVKQQSGFVSDCEWWGRHVREWRVDVGLDIRRRGMLNSRSEQEGGVD